MPNTPKHCEILQPASHGFTLDTELGLRRTHVRIFNFISTEFQGGRVELPAVLTPREACALLEEAVGELRRHADAMDAYAGTAVRNSNEPGIAAPAAVEIPQALLKLLAIDVDGVLNKTPEFIGGLLEPHIGQLKRVVDATGCRILVISTWRKSAHQMHRLGALLNSLGCEWEVMPVVDDCKSLDLDHWMINHPNAVAKLCVLDDELVRGYRDVQVLTASHLGLDEDTANLVIQMLNS